MSQISNRLRNLSPQQRRLLKQKLAQREGKASVAVSPTTAPKPIEGPSRPMDFSLFFFSADGTGVGQNRYQLLLECAALADQRGFSALWTPERHFQAFGGLYPNPSVLSAALAVRTERIGIRAGSVVLPLHSPVRVAEEWAVVDNLSGGRVGLSFATGWHSHDYVIAPEAYEERREIMFRNIPLVQRLWSGEEVEIPGVGGEPTKVRTLPRPIQKTLPIWVTASSPRTWRRAGEVGANVLSALIGTSLEQLAELVREYRQARRENGHDPRSGVVTLMLHTYLGKDLEATREKVRQPMKSYLRNFIDQLRPLAPDGLAAADGDEMESLLDFSFERYFAESSLLGTPEKCNELLHQLSAAGVDEAGCLVDFGLDLETTLEGLELLDQLRQNYNAEIAAAGASA